MSTIPTKRRKKEDASTILHRLKENGIEVEKQLKEFENLSSTNKDEATKFLMVVMKKFDLSKREMRACFPLTNRKWVQLRYNRNSNVKYNIQKIDSNIAGRLNNFLNNLKPQNEKVCEHHERLYFSRFKTINLLYEAYTTNDMYDKIKKTSFWKYLRERCPNFYTTCDTCMTKKRGRPRTERGDIKRIRLETLIPKMIAENRDTWYVLIMIKHTVKCHTLSPKISFPIVLIYFAVKFKMKIAQLMKLL